jgi:hypothetical protein
VQVDVSRPESRDAVAAAWSRCLRDIEHPPESDAGSPVMIDGLDKDHAMTEADLRVLAVRLSHVASAGFKGEGVVLNGFALADRTGGVTLVAGLRTREVIDALLTLAREDFGYVSGDLIGLLDDGTVVPFPQPVTRSASVVTPGEWTLRGPDDLGLQPCADPLRLAGILVLQQEQETSSGAGAVVESLDLMDALAVAAPLLRPDPTLDRPLQRLCAVIARAQRATRIVFPPEPGDVAATLREALAGTLAPSGEWSAVADSPANEMAWGLRDGRVRRMPWTDAVEVDDDALVLAAGVPLRLSGLGRTIWSTALEGVSLEQITEAAVAAHGAHPDAPAIVAAGVRELADSGALSCRSPLTLDRVLAGALMKARPGAASSAPE